MSGICGVIVRPGGPSIAPHEIERMCRRLSLTDGPPPPAFLTLGPVALGAQPFGRHQGGVARTEREGRPIAIAMLGALYDGDTGAPAERFLDRYLAEGLRFLEDVRGDASFAVWDGRTDELHVATDRFRYHSLYYADRPDQFVFGSRIQALFASPLAFRGTLRPEAIVDAVGTSIIPTPHTVYREVAKVPPASRLTHRAAAAPAAKATAVATYWPIDFRNPSRVGERALAATLRERFSE